MPRFPACKKKPVPTTTQGGQEGDESDADSGDSPQQRRGGGGGAAPDDADGDGPKKSVGFEYELATGKLTLLPDFEPTKKPVWASLAPDDTAVVFARGHNLYMMDAANYLKAKKSPGDASIVEVAITTDGEDHFGYDKRLSDDDRKALKKDSKDDKHKAGQRVPAITINWAKDSKKFSVVRRDERKVNDLWVINSLSTPRPTLESYRYAMPGEPNIAQPQIEIFDVASKGRVKVKADRFKDEALQIEQARGSALAREKEHTEPRWVSDGSDKLYFTRSSRDLHKFDLCVADTTTGEVKTLIEERLNVYIETRPVQPDQRRPGAGVVVGARRLGALLPLRRQRHAEAPDHLRRVRLRRHRLGRREGSDDAVHGGRPRGRRGSVLRARLPRRPRRRPGQAAGSRRRVARDQHQRLGHATSWTPPRASTRAPKSVLYDASGTPLGDLETTDVSAAVDAGFKFPESFKVKADDGITDIYGVMYKPFDFDPAKKYPIIAFVYPGPQTESVTKVFSPKSQNIALAQFGFIVIEVGNRGGNPNRSKWYHTFGYGNLRDYGLADKKAAIEQLAKRHSFIDIDRVGITGHSGGGFMSTAAMLVYPDFFKVGGLGVGQPREQRLQQHLEREAPRHQGSRRPRRRR